MPPRKFPHSRHVERNEVKSKHLYRIIIRLRFLHSAFGFGRNDEKGYPLLRRGIKGVGILAPLQVELSRT